MTDPTYYRDCADPSGKTCVDNGDGRLVPVERMTSPIIERAARAIAAIDYRKGVRDCERPDEIVFRSVPWAELPAKAQVESMEKARVALSASGVDELLVRAGALLGTASHDIDDPLAKEVIARWVNDANKVLREL